MPAWHENIFAASLAAHASSDICQILLSPDSNCCLRLLRSAGNNSNPIGAPKYTPALTHKEIRVTIPADFEMLGGKFRKIPTLRMN
jgi:hypothetical protein